MQGLLALIPVLGFPVIWCLALGAAAQLSGWNKLAKLYPDHDTHVDNWQGFCWGMFGIAGYKGCLWIAVAPQGLHIRTGPFWMFRPFHPPLMIPWSAIKSVDASTYWFRKVYRIELADVNVKITLQRKNLDGAQRFLGGKMNLIEKKEP